jgi:hypothetical protein
LKSLEGAKDINTGDDSETCSVSAVIEEANTEREITISGKNLVESIQKHFQKQWEEKPATVSAASSAFGGGYASSRPLFKSQIKSMITPNIELENNSSTAAVVEDMLYMFINGIGDLVKKKLLKDSHKYSFNIPTPYMSVEVDIPGDQNKISLMDGSFVDNTGIAASVYGIQQMKKKNTKIIALLNDRGIKEARKAVEKLFKGPMWQIFQKPKDMNLHKDLTCDKSDDKVGCVLLLSNLATVKNKYFGITEDEEKYKVELIFRSNFQDLPEITIDDKDIKKEFVKGYKVENDPSGTNKDSLLLEQPSSNSRKLGSKKSIAKETSFVEFGRVKRWGVETMKKVGKKANKRLVEAKQWVGKKKEQGVETIKKVGSKMKQVYKCGVYRPGAFFLGIKLKREMRKKHKNLNVFEGKLQNIIELKNALKKSRKSGNKKDMENLKYNVFTRFVSQAPILFQLLNFCHFKENKVKKYMQVLFVAIQKYLELHKKDLIKILDSLLIGKDPKKKKKKGKKGFFLKKLYSDLNSGRCVKEIASAAAWLASKTILKHFDEIDDKELHKLKVKTLEYYYPEELVNVKTIARTYQHYYRL